MVRCEDFYKKWEDNPNWCEKCDETVRRIDLYVDLVKEHPPIGGISEGATRPLFRIKDPIIKERAIAHIEKALTPRGRDGRAPKLTTKDIEEIIVDADVEVRNEAMDKEIAEIKAEEERTGIHAITQDEVDKLLDSPDPHTEKEVDEALRAVPEPSALIIATTTQDEIDAYFEMMQKIGCNEDIQKHRRRIQMMIDNKTLLLVVVDEQDYTEMVKCKT
jgi:hypothetical protein